MNELRKCSTRESCGETTGHQTPDLDFCQVITELRVVPSSTKAAHRHKSGAHCALCDSDSLCSVSTGSGIDQVRAEGGRGWSDCQPASKKSDN